MSDWHFTRRELGREARGLHRQMTLRRAATMLDVSPGQVARWRDGFALTGEMARRVATSIVARELGMVGVFGRVDTGGARIEARMDSHGVAVRVIGETTNERGGA